MKGNFKIVNLNNLTMIFPEFNFRILVQTTSSIYDEPGKKLKISSPMSINS